MLAAARDIMEFASGRSRDDLEDDRLLVRGILYTIGTLGEAASKLSRNFRDANPQIRWNALIKLRNNLIHDYYAIDFDGVWNAVEVELPSLISELEKLTITT